MIKIVYEDNPENGRMMMRAEGHANYAEKGKDIVCAAVSALMQTLAYSAAEDEHTSACCYNTTDGTPVMNVQADSTEPMRAKFELVADGLSLLAEQCPDHVRFKRVCAGCDAGINLQIFAEGGDGGGDAGSAGEAAAADSGVVEPPMRPAEEKLARCSGVLKRTNPRGAGLPSQESDAERGPGRTSQSAAQTAPLERGAKGSDENTELDEKDPADEGDGSKAEEKAQMTPEEHKKAFHALLQGEYRAETEELMQQAVERAAQILESSPQVKNLMEALHEAYGVDADDLEALTEAVKNGRVKDEAYFEKLAMEKGVSVATARQMDKLESENRRLSAAEKFAEDQRKAAQRQAEISRIHAEWDQEAQQLKAQYPEFDLKETLANPEIAKLMQLGVSMSNAYRAVYFDQIMAQNESRTAKQVEQGVEARIRQRGTRPGENGTRPGGAVQTHTDVNALTRKEREQLEKAALRGQVITF